MLKAFMSWSQLSLGVSIQGLLKIIQTKGAGFHMVLIKNSYLMASRLVVFIKGNDLDSPQVFNEVESLALTQYGGKLSEIVVIGEDQSSKVFQGRE